MEFFAKKSSSAESRVNVHHAYYNYDKQKKACLAFHLILEASINIFRPFVTKKERQMAGDFDWSDTIKFVLNISLLLSVNDEMRFGL